MATLTIKKSGGDAATLNAAEAYLSGTLAPISEALTITVEKDEFTETSSTTFGGGYGESASNTITLEPESGAGFAANHDYDASDVLDYDAGTSGGAGFLTSSSIVWTFGTEYMTVQDLMWKSTSSYSSTMVPINDDNMAFQRNIVRFEGRPGFVTVNEYDSDFINNLVISTNQRNNSNDRLVSFNQSGTGVLNAINNTICVSRSSSGNSAARVLYTGANEQRIAQNMFYHFNGEGTGTGDPWRKSGGAAQLGDYNVTNSTSSNKNGQSPPGANTDDTGVIADDFEDGLAASTTGAVDFRLKTGSLGIGFIPDGSEDSLTPTTDIRGQTRVGVDVDAGCFQVAAVQKILTANSGSYNLTGADVNFLRDFVISAEAGAYAITGQDAALVKTIIMVADAGSYTITGAAVTFLRDLLITAETGSYALTGTAVTLIRDLIIAVDAGSYSISGTDAGLLKSISLAADAGSYSISGTDANLIKDLILSAASGSYFISGTDAGLSRSVPLIADGGSYSISGTDANLIRDLLLGIDAGSYIISGTDANLLRNLLFDVGIGSYIISGQDVTFTISVFEILTSFPITLYAAQDASINLMAGLYESITLYASEDNETDLNS